ncbi:MAG TPA: arsinothricin resistance N-acetyltransferase ArsN1 family B [Candidatus Elarobacter sp.]|nr:arsinothricin resistance N-acetyltransferase ArsN1 family B [Candidatus Elarobacter sp.]
MRFMVIERFRHGDPAPVGERFRRQGRMMPDGVAYEASWIDPAGMRCFQVVQASSRDALDAWIARWNDLIEFEVVNVVDPGDFWAPAAFAERIVEPHLRNVRDDDAEAIARIYAPYVETTADSFEETAPDAAEMRRRFATVTASYPWLVATLGGEVAGYAYGTMHRARPAYRPSVEVSVYVDQSAQRRGIARLLYGALFRELAARGYHRAFAGITASNEGSIAFHRAVGFTPIGVFHEVGYKFGRWHDTSWWERDLSPIAPA